MSPYTWIWDVAPVTTFLEIIRLNLGDNRNWGPGNEHSTD